MSRRIMHEDADPEKDEEEVEPAARESPDGDTGAADAPYQKDLQEKSYYYDDSYGYEVYDPDEEDESDQDP